MSDPKRRFTERVRAALHGNPSPTIVGAEAVVIGDVRGKGSYLVFGEVQGDGYLEGHLHVADTGRWAGTIEAHQAIVAGRIQGTLIVHDTLEIGHTAVIRGRVSARTIAIARGAIIEGEIEVTSGIPVVQFEEKRRETGLPE